MRALQHRRPPLCEGSRFADALDRCQCSHRSAHFFLGSGSHIWFRMGKRFSLGRVANRWLSAALALVRSHSLLAFACKLLEGSIDFDHAQYHHRRGGWSRGWIGSGGVGWGTACQCGMRNTDVQMILEGIVTTFDENHQVHIAPMGPIIDSRMERLLFRPFKTAQTYRNLVAHPEGVFHVTDDVLLLARAALGKLEHLPPLKP